MCKHSITPGGTAAAPSSLCRVLYQMAPAPQPFTAGALNPMAPWRVSARATVADLLRNMAALPGVVGRLPHAAQRRISNPATGSACKMPSQAGGYHGPVTFATTSKTRLPGPWRAGRHRAHRRAPAHLLRPKHRWPREAWQRRRGNPDGRRGRRFALGGTPLAAVVRAEDSRIAPTALHDAVFRHCRSAPSGSRSARSLRAGFR